MLFSIITITRDNLEGLKTTQDSLHWQVCRDFEWIVIDGASKDGTKKYLQELSAHWISEKDEGIYDAMNKGIALATGELIGIINSGDYLETDAVENIVKAFVAHPDADVYHGMLRVFSESGQFMQVIGNASTFLSTGMIEHPTCFVKKSAYERFGYFDLRYKSSADYDFMLNLFEQKARFHFIECILANFFMGGMSSKSVAVLETVNIRYAHGLISSVKKSFLTALTQLRFALKK